MSDPILNWAQAHQREIVAQVGRASWPVQAPKARVIPAQAIGLG